jgi:heme a synthase
MTSLANAASPGLSRKAAGTSMLPVVRIWLFAVAAFVLAMVVVGGATRLTGSGLSITEWQPILGALPPMSEAAWQDAFEKYRHIPQYELVNKGISLEGFKAIYWWEWSHRLLGRLTGFVFLLPFVYFIWRRAIPKPFILKVGALFLLGGAQGALGWFMVMSGLTEPGRISVTQYRLAAHLALATAIAAYAFWLALTVEDESQEAGALSHSSAAPFAKLAALILAGLVYVQIIAGAFVAGLKAGYASDTWPLMNGEFIPSGMVVNFFEDPFTAQFVHRLIAYFIAIYAGLFALLVWRFPALRLPAAAIGAAVLVQIALGGATVVWGVPLGYALAHQASAMIVLAAALWCVRRAAAPLPA